MSSAKESRLYAQFHLTAAYAHLGRGPGSFPVAERLYTSVRSLPMYPELRKEQVYRVAEALREVLPRV